MKRVIVFSIFFILILNRLAAQNGIFDIRFALKYADCETNTMRVDVQVKAHDALHTFLMGDANFRFQYDPLTLQNPRIVSQDACSSLPPANDANYVAQNLNGSSAGSTKALVSLNVIYSGAKTSAKLFDTAWISISTIEFDMIDKTTCSNLNWNISTDFPATGMSEVIIANAAPFSYKTKEVGSGDIFKNLNFCPTEACIATANHAPVVVLPAISIYQNKQYSNCVKITDVDINDVHTATVCGDPTNGKLTLNVNTTTKNLCYTYIPTTNFVGTDQFCIKTCDQRGACITSNVPVIVNPIPLIDPCLTDKEAPVFKNCPNNITINTDKGKCDAVTTWIAPTATDNCTISKIISNIPNSSVLTKGIHAITYTATDVSGNTAICAFSITINDTEAPTIVGGCPSELKVNTEPGKCGATVNMPNFVDNCDGASNLSITSNAPTNNFFLVGTQNIHITAIDKSGNSSICNVNVIVTGISTPAPVTCPKDITVYSTESSCNALAYWQEPTAVDKCSNAKIEMTSNYKPSSSFVLGTTAVTYKTIDGKASCSFNVTVKDTLAPEFACPKNIHVSALGQIVNDPLGMILNLQKGTSCKNVQLNFDLPDAKDNCSGVANVAQIDKTGLSSGDYFPVGKTVLQFRASDLRGNKSFCEIPIIVDSIALPKILVENQKVCEGNAIYLKTEVVAGAKYKWVGPNGFTSTESNPVIGVSKASNAGKYALMVNFNDVCAASISDTINIAVINAIKAVADVDTIRNTQIYEGNVTINDKIASGEAYVVRLVSQPSTGVLSIGATGRFTYTPSKDFIGTVQFIYEICYNSCLSNCDRGIVTLEIRPNGSVCTVPTVITPNDDDLNDALYIDCLDERTNNQSEILIFNQWGDLIYSASPYKNDWKGTHKGKVLPDGTYYYLFKENTTSEVKKGFVTIFK